MRYSANLLGITALTAIITITPLFIPNSFSLTTDAAQITPATDRLAEADHLLDQGIQQSEVSQFQEALQSYQQALELYQDPTVQTEFPQESRLGEGRARHNLGLVYAAQGEHQQAIELYEQGLAIFRELNDRPREGIALKNLGNAYNSLGQYQQAVVFYEELLATNREIGDRAGEGITLNDIGAMYYNLGQYEQALGYYTDALAILQEVGDHAGVGQTLSNIGAVYYNLGQYEQTLRYYTDALATLQEVGDRAIELKVKVLSALIIVHTQIGNTDVALNYASQTEEALTKIENDEIVFTAFAALLQIYHLTGEFERAIKISEYGLNIAVDLGNSEAQALASAYLGYYHGFNGEYSKAIEVLNYSLENARESENKFLESLALIFLADIYDSQGNHMDSVNTAERALELAIQIGDRELEARALVVIASSSHSLGLFHESISAAERSIEISRELGLIDVLVQAFLTLGFAYADLGDYETFLDSTQEFTRLLEEIPDQRNEGLAERIVEFDKLFSGVYFLTQGQYQELVEKVNSIDIGKFSDVLTEFQVNTLNISIQIILAAGYGGLEQYDAGLNAAHEGLLLAEEMNAYEEQGMALFVMGGLYRKSGELDLALEAYQRALLLDDSYLYITGLARVYRARGMTSTAISHYKEAVNTIESVRDNVSNLDADLQQSFLAKAFVDFDGSKVSDVYRELADLLLSEGRISEAQQVLDLVKIEELKDFASTTRATWEGAELAYTKPEQKIIDDHDSLIALGGEIIACEETGCAELETLYGQLEGLKAQYEEQVAEFEATIRESRAEDDIFQDLNNLSGESERLLNAYAEDGQKAVLLYPFVLEDKLWLVWVTAGNVIGSVEVSVSQRELATTVQRFGELLNSPSSESLSELQATSNQLYNWIIKPLEAELDKNDIDHLIFVNDRVTRYIPMAALFDGERFLLERYRISTVLAPSLTDTTARLASVENTNVLGLGLSHAVADFSALPGVVKELTAIVRNGARGLSGIYPGQVLLDGDFTLESLQANVANYQVLHVATHAAFVPGRAEESFIVLGNGERLTTTDIEVMERRLRNLHLVVLSACQTALGGEAGDGTEIAGISSYFLEAGRAETVIASLWKVNDDSTSLLMQRFYELLATGELTKAEALRQAQLSLLYDQDIETRLANSRGTLSRNSPPADLAGFQHPYHWAPFILIGNGL